MATVPRTADLPSWARGLNAYEAETSLGGDTPEEAFGFKASGSTGRPGMIKGSSKTQDMAATRAFRNRTSPGGVYPSNADLNNKFRAQDDQAKMSRAGMWDNFVRSNRPPMHGEMRKGSDGQMWKYNAATGHGEPVQGAAPAVTAGATASIGTANSVPAPTNTPVPNAASQRNPAFVGPPAPGKINYGTGERPKWFSGGQEVGAAPPPAPPAPEQAAADARKSALDSLQPKGVRSKTRDLDQSLPPTARALAEQANSQINRAKSRPSWVDTKGSGISSTVTTSRVPVTTTPLSGSTQPAVSSQPSLSRGGGAGTGTTGPKQSGSRSGGSDADQFQQRLSASMTIGNNAKPYSSTRVGGAMPMGKRPKWAA